MVEYRKELVAARMRMEEYPEALQDVVQGIHGGKKYGY